MIHTTTLPDGTLKHRMDGWTGYQDPNQSMAKTKWYKDGTKYWEVTTPSKSRPGQTNTYIVTRDGNNRTNCSCLGFKYHRKCRHLEEITDADILTV